VLSVGIDLSSQDRDTALCALRWEGSGARVEHLEQDLDNQQLLSWMHDATVSGLDAPFGWPERLLASLQQWSEADQWPAPWPDAAAKAELRLRATDRWVQQHLGKQPLSVSSSGIAVTAFRAAALLTAFQTDDSGPFDRICGPVREVYPGAALLAWKLVEPRAAESYKTSAAARRELLKQMAPPAGWLRLEAQQREACIEHDHQLDALVSALVARAAQLGLCHLPPAELDSDLVAREGWIALPLHDSWDALSPGGRD